MPVCGCSVLYTGCRLLAVMLSRHRPSGTQDQSRGAGKTADDNSLASSNRAYEEDGVALVRVDRGVR